MRARGGQGGGGVPKPAAQLPAAQLPAAFPSFVPSPDLPGASREVQCWWLNHRWRSRLAAGAHSPTRTTREGPRQKYPTYTSTPRSSKTGMTLLPTAPVEPPVTAVVAVEQVAQKRKASSPLPPKTVTRPVSPPSPTRWEIA